MTDQSGSVVSSITTLFEACPDLAVIVSSTDPNPALMSTIVSYTLTARAVSTRTVVEDLGGQGIQYRVESDNHKYLDRPLEAQGQLRVSVDLGDAVDAAQGYAPMFCVYSASGIPHATLDAIRVDGHQVFGGFSGEDSSGAGRYPEVSGQLRYCIPIPSAWLHTGYHRFVIDLAWPARFDAAFVKMYRTNPCLDPEPWKDEYPICANN